VGWLQLAFLEIEGRKAAAYLNFVYNNRVLVYNSGLDWRSFPPVRRGFRPHRLLHPPRY